MTQRGFTIVELLIVIVVIAILAAISMVAYTNIQANARDSQRQQDMNTLTKALEMYYIDNGRFPTSDGSTAINSGWSTTTDGSWGHLASQLVPKYITEMPTDPVNTTDASLVVGPSAAGYGYAYVTGAFCGASAGQMYLLLYRYEAKSNVNTTTGACPSSPVGYYLSSSNIRYVK